MGPCAALEGFAESRRDSWTSADKREHFTAGVAIATVVDIGVQAFQPRMGPWRRGTIAFAAAVLAGTLKEVYDAQHPRTHSASVKDAAWTYAGGAVGAIAIEWTIRF